MAPPLLNHILNFPSPFQLPAEFMIEKKLSNVSIREIFQTYHIYLQYLEKYASVNKVNP